MMALRTKELDAMLALVGVFEELIGDDAPLVQQLRAYQGSRDRAMVTPSVVEAAVLGLGDQAQALPPAWSADHSRASRAMDALRSLPVDDVTSFETTDADMVLVVHASPLGIRGLEWVYPESRESMTVPDAGRA